MQILHFVNVPVFKVILFKLWWQLRLGKFFPSLDPKADSKIVLLDLLQLAVGGHSLLILCKPQWQLSMRLDKFFPSLDPKADSKIVLLDLLGLAVGGHSLPLLSVSIYYFCRPQGQHTYIGFKAWLEHFVRIRSHQDPSVSPHGASV